MKKIVLLRSQSHPIMFGTVLFVIGLMYHSQVLSQFGQNSSEGASALNPARMEISLYGGGSYFSNDYGHGDWGYIPGLKVGIGIVKNFDVKMSYSRGFYSFTKKLKDSKENNICIMPKVSMLNEHLAFQVPFTIILYNWEYAGVSKTETAFMLQPKLIGSFRIGQVAEFSLSPVLDIMMQDGAVPTYWLGGNLGMAFSTNLNRWSVRPEGFINYMVSDNPLKMMYYGWGLAFTYNIDFRKGGAE